MASCRESPPLRSRERPVLKTVAACAKDESVRLQSSCGGIFTVLAERVLDDGGVVVGVAQTAPTRFRSGKSVSVHHGRSKYMRLFLSRICQNVSCAECRYRKLLRIADITLGDSGESPGITPKWMTTREHR